MPQALLPQLWFLFTPQCLGSQPPVLTRVPPPYLWASGHLLGRLSLPDPISLCLSPPFCTGHLSVLQSPILSRPPFLRFVCSQVSLCSALTGSAASSLFFASLLFLAATILCVGTSHLLRPFLSHLHLRQRGLTSCPACVPISSLSTA